MNLNVVLVCGLVYIFWCILFLVTFSTCRTWLKIRFEQAIRFSLLSGLIAMAIIYPVAANVTARDGTLLQLLSALFGAAVGLGTSILVFRYLQTNSKLSHGKICLVCFVIQATGVWVVTALL